MISWHSQAVLSGGSSEDLLGSTSETLKEDPSQALLKENLRIKARTPSSYVITEIPEASFAPPQNAIVLAWLNEKGFKNSSGYLTRNPKLNTMNISGRLEPLFQELTQEWGLSVEDIEDRTDLLSYSLTKIKSLREGLNTLCLISTGKNFDFNSLSVGHRYELIMYLNIKFVLDALQKTLNFETPIDLDNILPEHAANMAPLFISGNIHRLLRRTLTEATIQRVAASKTSLIPFGEVEVLAWLDEKGFKNPHQFLVLNPILKSKSAPLYLEPLFLELTEHWGFSIDDIQKTHGLLQNRSARVEDLRKGLNSLSLASTGKPFDVKTIEIDRRVQIIQSLTLENIIDNIQSVLGFEDSLDLTFITPEQAVKIAPLFNSGMIQQLFRKKLTEYAQERIAANSVNPVPSGEKEVLKWLEKKGFKNPALYLEKNPRLTTLSIPLKLEPFLKEVTQEWNLSVDYIETLSGFFYYGIAKIQNLREGLNMLSQAALGRHFDLHALSPSQRAEIIRTQSIEKILKNIEEVLNLTTPIDLENISPEQAHLIAPLFISGTIKGLLKKTIASRTKRQITDLLRTTSPQNEN